MNVVLRAMGAYWVLLIAVRLIGRRTASMMAPFDLIVLFLFAGATITPLLGEDHSVVAACSTVCTIGLNHLLVSWLKSRWPLFGRLVDGTPVVIFGNGDWHHNRMRRMRIERSDVMAAVRQSGLQRLEQISCAVVERDGKVLVIPPNEEK